MSLQPRLDVRSRMRRRVVEHDVQFTSAVVSAEKLKTYGFSIAIYPSAGMGPACFALHSSYEFLLKNGSTERSPLPAYDMKQLHELVGFADVWEFERKHVETK